jgi:hypothetical protein
MKTALSHFKAPYWRFQGEIMEYVKNFVQDSQQPMRD